MKFLGRWKIFLAGAAFFLSLLSTTGFAVPTPTPPEGAVRQEIRDIKGPLAPTRLLPWLLPVGAPLLLATVALSIFMIRRGRRSRVRQFQPSPPSLETALDTLEVRFSDGQEEICLLYEELSSLIRLSLEQQTGLSARQMTSEEILEGIAVRGPTLPVDMKQLELFLLRCDLVKFAGATPAATEIREDLAAARSIIQKMFCVESL